MTRIEAGRLEERRKIGEKGFFGVSYFRDRPETGFFRDISFQPADSAKNPVSPSRIASVQYIGPETGFFRDISFQPADSAKNPVSPSHIASVQKYKE